MTILARVGGKRPRMLPGNGSFTDPTMTVGVETRVPLLDMALVRKACQFPSSWLVQGGVDKLILRNAARGWLDYEAVQNARRMSQAGNTDLYMLLGDYYGGALGSAVY